MLMRRPWTHQERLLAFRLYCLTPFGKLHQHNPAIIELANMIGRTPSAVAMKACNFASLDPIQQNRSISALGNVSRDDRNLWESFIHNPESVAADAELTLLMFAQKGRTDIDKDFELPDGDTEREQIVRTRRVQSFFRAALLSSYENRCALSDIVVPELLNASHIVPWKADVARRADPRNGILLNILLDRAFDRGFITFDESLRLVLSERLKKGKIPDYQQRCLLDLEGKTLRLPQRFAPDPLALSYHREKIFM